MVSGSSSFWDLERGGSVPEDGAWATPLETQRKQPAGLMGADEMLWMLLSDYAERIDCLGRCLPGTETQTRKCQAYDVKASPSSRVSRVPGMQAQREIKGSWVGQGPRGLWPGRHLHGGVKSIYVLGSCTCKQTGG